MFDFEGSKKRKSVIVLQLAPMIDIFVLVIVFLLKGTVMSETVISTPDIVEFAKSESRETTEIAPEVYISQTEVDFRMIEHRMSIYEILRDELDPKDPVFDKFREFNASNPEMSGNTLMHINVVADYRTNYKTLYHVVRLLRQAGFKAMLFIAEANGT